MRQAIVIATSPDRTPWLSNCFHHLNRAGAPYPVLTVSAGANALDRVRYVLENTLIDEFLFLHDTCEVKGPGLFDIVFEKHRGVSVALCVSPVKFGASLAKYRRATLGLLPEIPCAQTKVAAMAAEIDFARRYAAAEPAAIVLEPALHARQTFEEKFGQMHMVLENQYLRKYESCWSCAMAQEAEAQGARCAQDPAMEKPLGSDGGTVNHNPTRRAVVCDLIRQARIETLRDRQFLTALIANIGIHDLGPNRIWSPAFYGLRCPDGLLQNPSQMAELLADLSWQNIESMVEIGTGTGDSIMIFHNVLRRFNPNLRSVTVDLNSSPSPEFPADPNISVLRGNRQAVAQKPFDLCFIDADHGYGAVKADWEEVGRFARICVFHDIVDQYFPDVARFWAEVKQGRRHKEIIDDGLNMGYGVIYAQETL